MVSLIAVGAVVGAVLLDWCFGDPPNRFHPVVAMGNWIAWTRRIATSQNDTIRFCIGSISLALGVICVFAIGLGIEKISRFVPFLVAVILQVLVLKSTLSIRSLARAAGSVAIALRDSDLELARQRVAYHLVSRDVSNLDESALSAAVIESVAENTSDSFVAPLFYFAIAGLPGALVYRFVNTSDAMLGYRTKELEWFGKPAARLDDLLNLIPARLTALIMLLVGHVNGVSRRAAFAVWLRDSRLTASPNSGHPMSAASGLLGVVLEKRDHYRLGSEFPPPKINAIGASVQLMYRTALTFVVVVVVWCYLKSVLLGRLV